MQQCLATSITSLCYQHCFFLLKPKYGTTPDTGKENNSVQAETNAISTAPLFCTIHIMLRSHSFLYILTHYHHILLLDVYTHTSFSWFMGYPCKLSIEFMTLASICPNSPSVQEGWFTLFDYCMLKLVVVPAEWKDRALQRSSQHPASSQLNPDPQKVAVWAHVTFIPGWIETSKHTKDLYFKDTPVLLVVAQWDLSAWPGCFC